ncbi:MAG: helix-turn-helix transcriptional regulator [Bacteroidetes bacterium]|nr:helix-turn-helix transcriptional regulator [Bacteroidota bacterium]
MSINIRNKEVLVKFGERLKAVRLQKGLTQEQLAYDAEIELSQVHRLEAGKTNATISTITSVAKALNMTISELFKGV